MNAKKISLVTLVITLSVVSGVLACNEISEVYKPSVASISTVKPEVAELAMINLTNDYRSSHGLTALSINGNLMDSAQTKADDLCTSGKWSHLDSKGRKFSNFITEAGYNYERAGENLAHGFSTQETAFDALLNSPGHLANIVGMYKEIGVGFSPCNGKNYVAIHYGERQ